MALIRCDECGQMVSDKAEACPNCGCPVEKKNVCEECGEMVSYGAKACPNCGCPIGVTTSNNFGILHLEWEGGKWAIYDVSVPLFINGQLIGKYSFKEGFEVNVPITLENMEIVVKCGFRTFKHSFTVVPNQDYTCTLIYSKITGGFGFKMEDENGNVESAHLSAFMGILIFLFPIIGILYAIRVKEDSPSVYQTAMITAVCGFLGGLVFMSLGGGYPFFLTLIFSLGGGGFLMINRILLFDYQLLNNYL